MYVLVADSETARADSVARAIQQAGVHVEVATDAEQLSMRLLDTQAPDLILVDAEMSNGTGLSVCVEVRRRYVGPSLPEVVLTGVAQNAAQMMSAFEAGVSNWIPHHSAQLVDKHVRRAQSLRKLPDLGSQRNEGLAYLEHLPVHAEGLLRVEDAHLRVEVAVRAGKIGAFHFPDLRTPFTDLIDSEVQSRCPEVDAVRKILRYPVHDWRQLLVENGCWSRARFREALGWHSEQAVRWIAASNPSWVEWRNTDARFAEELGFEPSLLLANLDEPVPHSYVRGRVSFQPIGAANDTLLADVS